MQLNFQTYHIIPIQPKNGWKVCNFAVANEDRLKIYFSKTLEENLTPALSNIFVTKKVKQFIDKEEYLFTLIENETRKLVALIYIKAIDWIKKQGEFAYAIDYNFEGKGLTTEAVKQLSYYAFKILGLETLQIIVHKSNVGSLKVAENNNFTWVKTLKNEFTPPNGKPLNMELYELYNKIK